MRAVWGERLLVAVCALIQFANVTPGAGSQHPSWLGGVSSLAGLAGGLVLGWRRRAPIAVVGAATGCYVLQAAIVGAVVPVAAVVAGYSVARYVPPVRGPLMGLLPAVAVAGTVAVRGPVELAPTYAAVLLVAVLVGTLGSARQARAEATTRTAVLEERLRIARDLHDVVGHGMGAITLQAGTGRMALDAGAENEVRRALVSIEESGRGVLREVRWLVGVLRDRPERPTTSDLARLADAASSAGVQVELSVDPLVEEELPTETAEALYRIVQEGLTNVLRHSVADRVEVTVTDDGLITLTVVDNGIGAPAAEGSGIRGMRERAAAVGGELSAGPRPDASGWQIVAQLPTAPAPVGRRSRWRAAVRGEPESRR